MYHIVTRINNHCSTSPPYLKYKATFSVRIDHARRFLYVYRHISEIVPMILWKFKPIILLDHLVDACRIRISPINLSASPA